MAEEMVELGFEGLDKFTDKYFDKTYDRLPAFPKSAKKKRKLQAQSGQYRQNAQGQPVQNAQQPSYPAQNASRHPDKGYTSPRSAAPKSVDGYNSDPEMYAPDYGQDRYGPDARYYETEQNDHRAPGPGFKVPRGRDGPSDTRDMQPYPQQNQPDYGQQRGYGGAGGRPGAQRRGSSWSPPRSERQGRRDTRRRQSNSRSRSRHDMKSRLIATVGGALVGGIAGNQATKGKKYDTVATIAGAIIGGVGAKEAAGHWDERKRKKEQQKNGDWEEDSDDNKRRNDRRRDDRYDRNDRYDDRYERDDRRRY
ncbi:hypothetical protein BKA58DRAFT_20607 [Alternaria rosae]|uniref:uncharacterized protein n=1 Tax=Alternaria rosae TaxID=1187941 RepID=UPI001E8DD70F|nr:uncharacterized protein BKA58DRAFT_20607 [Alternaria rosae]KAH6882497.1 hypothetical protein BKA58DRAFT_20607 [Alternaria rosae]